MTTTVESTPHLAVVYTIEPGWHIYWENPGDSGMPTVAEFSRGELPPSSAPQADSRGLVGPAKYPGPDKFVGAGDIVNYGWENQATLLFALTDHAFSGTIHTETRWLACREDGCVPGSASLSLVLPSAPVVVDTSRLPSPLAGVETPTSLTFQLPDVTEVFLDTALSAVASKTIISGGTVRVELRAARPPGAKLVAKSGGKYYQVPEVP